MAEWMYAQEDPAEELCQIHHFSVKKSQAGTRIEFLITVREYVAPHDPALRFLAQADKETNQRTAPYLPTGWGASLSMALSECMKAIRRFPYEPLEAD